MIRFEDDIAIVSEDEHQLETTLNEMQTVFANRFKLNINKNKTKILVVSKNGKKAQVMLDIVSLESVDELPYINNKITTDVKCKR